MDLSQPTKPHFMTLLLQAGPQLLPSIRCILHEAWTATRWLWQGDFWHYLLSCQVYPPPADIWTQECQKDVSWQYDECWKYLHLSCIATVDHYRSHHMYRIALKVHQSLLDYLHHQAMNTVPNSENKVIEIRLHTMFKAIAADVLTTMDATFGIKPVFPTLEGRWTTHCWVSCNQLICCFCIIIKAKVIIFCRITFHTLVIIMIMAVIMIVGSEIFWLV